ncbi:MAG: zinc ribbon domain-containing protein [Candidatus Dormiibacterota bacterium]
MSISQRSSGWATQGTLLATAALLFFIDLFLPWSRGCYGIHVFTPQPGPFGHVPGGHDFATICSAQIGGWGGAGTVAGVLAGLLFVWEAARVARLTLGLGLGHRSLVSAALAFGVLIFSVITVVARLTWGAQAGYFVYGGLFVWIALALGILIGLAGLVHWRVWEANAPVSVVGPAESPPVVVPPQPPGTCPNCGHVNGADARFCSACGTNLGSPVPRRRSTRRTPPSS